MFKQLKPLASVVNLTIQILNQEDENLQVIVSLNPKTKDDCKMKLEPIFMEGTVEDLDREFGELIKLYVKKDKMLSEMIATDEIPTEAKALNVLKMKATGTLTKKEVDVVEKSEKIEELTEEQAMIEESMAVPVPEPKIEEKEEVKETPDKKVEIDTSPKDPEQAKLKAAGEPYYNRRGIMIWPKEEVEEEVKVKETPVITMPEEEIVVTEEPVIEIFSVDEIVSEANPLQEQFNKVLALAESLNLKLDNFNIETQTAEKLSLLEKALNARKSKS